MIFELVLYLREIDPKTELAWTKWIKEEEENYNEIFLAEGIKEVPPSNLVDVANIWARKWAEFTRWN